MRRLDDSGLVALINKQGEKGLDVMYRQYRGEFLNWGRSYFRTSDNHVLIDLYTDSCLSAYDNVRSGKYRLTENAGFKSYLFKIAVFKFKNRARGLANDPIANSVADFFEKFEKKINNADARTVPEMFPQYEKIVDDNEIDETRKHKVKIVREVVFCEMTEPCKSLLKYIYYDKLTGKDITALMPYKNTDTVKSQALRCRRRINRIFAPFSSVAAAVCIICGFFIHDRNVQNCLMLADSCLSGELVPPSRGGIDLDPVVKAIEEENFDEAHALIKQLREEPVPEFDLSTETGRGYHMQYQFDMQTVDYLEAITYIKEGKPGRAKRALKRISSSDTSYYNEEAKELLDKLQ